MKEVFGAAVCAALGFAVWVSPAAAAQKEVTFKLTGRHGGGNINFYDPVANVQFTGFFEPAISSTGVEGVFATWSVCVPPDFFCTDQVIGLFPISAVKSDARKGHLLLEFDTSKAVEILFSLGPSTWKGTLTRYEGVFSYSTVSTGKVETRFVEPSATGTGTIASVRKSSGRREEFSANFAGTIGWAAVGAAGSGANAFLSQESGATVSVVIAGR
jgi:hypothetical protein